MVASPRVRRHSITTFRTGHRAQDTSRGPPGGSLTPSPGRPVSARVAEVTLRDLRLARTLTEQTTQKALSVKAGQPPVSVHVFEARLRRLLKGEAWDLPADDDLAQILEPMRSLWLELAERFGPEASAVWLEWLRAPHELAEIPGRAAEVRLPLEDVRVSAFVQGSGPDQS